jgi:CRISPR-associated protein Cas1
MCSYGLLLKTRELAQYLVGKRKIIDFSNPAYSVERQDSDDIRQKILSISYSEWKKMGFSKGNIALYKEKC